MNARRALFGLPLLGLAFALNAQTYGPQDEGRRFDDGSVVRYMGQDAVLDLSELVQTYSDMDYWKPLSPTSLLNDAITYAALSALGTALNRDDLTGAAESYFGLVDHNDLRSQVRASIVDSPLHVTGAVIVSATDEASAPTSDDFWIRPSPSRSH